MKQTDIKIIDNRKSRDEFLNIIADEVASVCSDDAFITIDTEFIREGVQVPLLCLMQIATENYNFVIDPLAMDISFLRDIFSNKQILKVFHAAYQDIEMLSTFDISVNNIYDTQIYEMLLNTNERVGYRALVSKYLNRKLKKAYSLSDWSIRPLSKKQLLYSVEDVFFLRDIYKCQIQALRKLGRMGWLDEEMIQLAGGKRATCNANTDNNVIDDVYRKLADWRTERANKRNINPESIVSDDIIRLISKKGKNFVTNIKNSRHMKNENMVEFLAFAEQIVDDVTPVTSNSGRNVMLYMLKTILGIVSRKNNIATSIIATTGDLEEIVLGNNSGKCFFGWRKKIFGDYVTRLFNGTLSVFMKDSEMQLSISDDKVTL